MRKRILRVEDAIARQRRGRRVAFLTGVVLGVMLTLAVGGVAAAVFF